MQFLLFKMTRYMYNKSSIDRQMTYWRFNGCPNFFFKVLFMASLSSGVKKTLFVVNCSKEYHSNSSRQKNNNFIRSIK